MQKTFNTSLKEAIDGINKKIELLELKTKISKLKKESKKLKYAYFKKLMALVGIWRKAQ